MRSMVTTAGKDDDAATWKRCSTCRGPIDFGTTYYVCSVSTCNRKRVTYRFCTVECWEEHLPLMRHREAWAVEETAPTKEAWEAQTGQAPAPRRKPTTEVAALESPAPAKREPGGPRRRIRVGSAPRMVAPEPGEILVVVSRFKNHVRERFGMNTSDAVMDVLSSHLRSICHRAVENARADGRKTLMDRDFEFLRRR
jgi:hypothetical protein